MRHEFHEWALIGADLFNRRKGRERRRAFPIGSSRERTPKAGHATKAERRREAEERWKSGAKVYSSRPLVWERNPAFAVKPSPHCIVFLDAALKSSIPSRFARHWLAVAAPTKQIIRIVRSILTSVLSQTTDAFAA